MRGNFFTLLLAALLTGCVTSPTIPRTGRAFPANALITQRGILTARGRQFPLNGYLSLSETNGMRLIVTENFGSVLADVLVRRDGTVRVMRSSPAFRPAWIERYVAADLKCIFGDAPEEKCPGQMLSPTHFVIKHFWYSLDLQIVEIKPGVQPAEMFEEKPKPTP